MCGEDTKFSTVVVIIPILLSARVVPVVMDLISEKKRPPDIIVRFIMSLVNMMLADPKLSKPVMRECNIEEILKHIRDTHPQNQQLQQAMNTFGTVLCQVDVISGDGKSCFKLPSIDERIRTFLVAGSVLRVHRSSGSPQKMHVFCSNDLRFIVWRSQENTQIYESIFLPSIEAIKDGAYTNELKQSYFRAPKAISEHSFVVIGKKKSLSVECDSQTNRDIWVDNLETAIEFIKAVMKLRE